MEQVCIRWQNIIDHGDSGLLVGELPLSIGHAETNDVVLPASTAGACYNDVRLASAGDELVLINLCLTQLNGRYSQVGEQQITPKNRFYLGLYRLTIETSH